MGFATKVTAFFLLSSNLSAFCYASDWNSSSHFAYGVVRNSSVGFDQAKGSNLFFDLTYRLLPKTKLGLRTMAQGAESRHGKFHRLSTGPLFSLGFFDAWSVEFALCIFNELAKAGNGKKLYVSDGKTALIGWQRNWAVGDRIRVGWGGFLQRHWGTLTDPAKTIRAGDNIGNTQGLKLALEFLL